MTKVFREYRFEGSILAASRDEALEALSERLDHDEEIDGLDYQILIWGVKS